MTSYHAIVEACSRWIDRVAVTILDGRESLRTRPRVAFVEQQDGSFTLQGTGQEEVEDLLGQPFQFTGKGVDAAVAEKLGGILRGAHVELVLQPKRFIFRPLELPRRALDFLEGIVRAQIDRLTPWSAAEAAFGWQSSIDPANDRIEVTIAATARTLIAPFISALADLGADTVTISAALPQPESDHAAIKICEQKSKQAADLPRVRRVLIGIVAGGGALASVSIAANAVIGGTFESWQADLSRRITEHRAALLDRTSEGVRDLERQKHQTPSSVIVIEALSKLLPDDTYLSELRILGDKMQLVGMTKDAPALIRLIEQSSHFSRAVFFAPTTRSASEQSEHFHIEAHIEPVYTPGL